MDVVWPRRGDDPVQRAEYARVSTGRGAAQREYERSLRHYERLLAQLPGPVRRVLEADPYGPPPIAWDEVAPYLLSAWGAAHDEGDSYSFEAAEFLRRIGRWFDIGAANWDRGGGKTETGMGP